VQFQAKGHRITAELLQYTRDMLTIGTYNLKEVSEIPGLENIFKAIDKKVTRRSALTMARKI
jgi:hypothetical protein